MKKGDKVIIEFRGKRIEGKVLLASPNERSLALAFDAILDGWAGIMPVLLEDDGVYRTLIYQEEVKLELIPLQ